MRRVLKKLHDYRNELYHRDHLRFATIQSACLIYFELVCSLFERGNDFPMEPLVFTGPPTAGSVPSRAKIAFHLRSDLGVGKGGSLNDALVSHVTSRLDEIDSSLGWLSEMLPGFDREDLIRLAQVHDEQLPDSLESLRKMKSRYAATDLRRWRSSAAVMRSIDDRLELFAAFADIEDDFEPCEVHIDRLAEQVDREIERKIDIERGK
jgi:hypothetical protein